MPKFFEQLIAVWKKLEGQQKVIITLALIGVVLVFGAIGYYATRPDYTLLAADLRPAQASKIVAYLESNHVANQVIDNGTAVLVPTKDLHRMRNELSERELLGDGSHGFELLSQGHMWDSTFAEHKNYDRAVQGELERSFRELTGVNSARVIIDRPPPSPFMNDEEAKPKASIKLDMKAGMHLTQSQIAGIVNLTSGAVAGMTPDRVQIMDNGGLLTQAQQDSGAMAAQTSMDAEVAREAYLTRKAQDLLDTILGPGHSSVKVAVKLDFTKRSEASTNPTPGVATRESVTTTDERTPVIGTGGVAGTASNIEEAGTASRTTALASKTSEETKNEFAVGKKTVTQEDEIGRIKGMTVSILLDYKNAGKVDKLDDKGQPMKDEKGNPVKEDKREEYPDAERKKFQALVLSAIGFDAAKGIQMQQQGESETTVANRFKVEIQSMDMHKESEPAVQQASMLPSFLGNDIKTVAGYAVAGIVALVMLFMARGQLKKSQKAWADQQERERTAEQERERRSQREQADPGNKERRQLLKDAVRKKVQENPAAAAQILRKWIAE